MFRPIEHFQHLEVLGMSVPSWKLHCVIMIGQWMSANKLKLNAEKTELMWAGTRYSVAIFSATTT